VHYTTTGLTPHQKTAPPPHLIRRIGSQQVG